jgi:hypothetical protein
MGSITRGLSNNITTGGVILPAGITNASVADVTSFANASGGTLILLSTQTASGSANISFTTGLDSTYDAYEFHFMNIHPATDGAEFEFNLSTDSGSNYNVTKTTTYFEAYNNEAGSPSALEYVASRDLAQGTGFQVLMQNLDSENDACGTGILTLFNPASTTYVKHFTSNIQFDYDGDYTVNAYISGYANTTSAVNAIRFQMSTGNIDDGIIKLYGVKKS